MHHLVAATLLTVVPSPLDHLTAAADLTAPADAPPLTARSPRMRLAMLTQLVRLDALDADAPDLNWFGPGLSWESELTLARGLVARVRTCPTLAEDWIPAPEWFRAEAAAFEVCAAAWRRRGCDYWERVEWEPDRADALRAWAFYMDGQATRYTEEGIRMAWFAARTWDRPRRVVLHECKEWMGEDRWRARRWPD